MIRILGSEEAEAAAAEAMESGRSILSSAILDGSSWGYVAEGDGFIASIYHGVCTIGRTEGKAIPDQWCRRLSCCRTVLGRKEDLLPILPYLPAFNPQERCLMRLDRSSCHPGAVDQRVRMLNTEKDFRMLFSLYRAVPGMEGGYEKENDEENAASFASRPFPFVAVAFIEDGKAVSGGYIGNAGTHSPMISGIATHPRFRGRGYASKVIEALISISFNQNGLKHLHLWYENEDAGRLYRSLGFQTDGSWILLRREKG